MTRIDSVRAATGSAKESARHAAEAVAPYAETAKERAAHLSHEARVRLAPKVSLAAAQAADQARLRYDAHLAPHVEHALAHVPPMVDEVAHKAAVHTKRAAHQAAAYSRPRLEQAVAAAQPAREEAAARSAAALAALRGQVSAQQIEKLARKQQRKGRGKRFAVSILVLGAVSGAALAAWKWWDKQANPDWLVEPPAPTEVPDGPPLTSVDGTGQGLLDPEVRAKQADAEADSLDEEGGSRSA